MSYKRIVAAVDGSKISNLVFKEALYLAKALHSKLYILHIIERLPDHVAYAIDVSKYQLQATKAGEKLLAKFDALAKKNKISTETKLIEIINFKDNVSNKILKATKSWKADLLVMGTHGRTGFSHFMLGSVTEETLKTLKTPILIIHGKEE